MAEGQWSKRYWNPSEDRTQVADQAWKLWDLPGRASKLMCFSAKKLSLYQILAPNAFNTVEEFVPILQKRVSAVIHEVIPGQASLQSSAGVLPYTTSHLILHSDSGSLGHRQTSMGVRAWLVFRFSIQDSRVLIKSRIMMLGMQFMDGVYSTCIGPWVQYSAPKYKQTNKQK